MAVQKQGDQLKPAYSSSVGIHGVVLKTCQKLGIIGTGGERGPGISVRMARQDDDNDGEMIDCSEFDCMIKICGKRLGKKYVERPEDVR